MSHAKAELASHAEESPARDSLCDIVPHRGWRECRRAVENPRAASKGLAPVWVYGGQWMEGTMHQRETAAGLAVRLALLTATALVLAWEPAQAELLLPGKRLLIKNRIPDDVTKNRIKVSGEAPSIPIPVPGSADDPRCEPEGSGRGGAIAVESESTAERFWQALPCEGWKLRGRESSPRGYTYRDGQRAFGPCSSVVLQTGRLRAKCGGRVALDYDLVEGVSQLPVGVEVLLGEAVELCMDFSEVATGPTRTGADGRQVSVRDSPPGAACRYLTCEPTGPDVCDGIDNDCDGVIDNLGSGCPNELFSASLTLTALGAVSFPPFTFTASPISLGAANGSGSTATWSVQPDALPTGWFTWPVALSPVTAVRFEVRGNDAGSVAASTPASIALDALVELQGFGGFTLLGIPLLLGVPSTYVPPGPYGINFTTYGNAWTTKTTSIQFPVSNGLSTVTAMGSNNLVSGVGTVTMVSAQHVVWTLSGDWVVVAELTLVYAPNHGAGALFAGASVLLVAIGRRKRSRETR